MKKKGASESLKEMILLKEAERDLAGKLFKKDLNLVYESLRPVNLIKKAIRNMIETQNITGSMLDSSIGIAAGYLSKKVIVGVSHNPLLKLAGSILQFGVSSIVMKKPEAIKLFGKKILRSIFRKNEIRS